MMSTSRKRQTFAPEPDAIGQKCACAGCALAGEYRAPKSRATLHEFHWFCLEHVRAYNAAWDFYKGMSAMEIEAELRADASWQRPSWPLGHGNRRERMEEAVEAELHAFAFSARTKPAPKQDLAADLRAALDTFGMVWPVTLEAVKTQYKTLAKRHHPDANPGDKHAEETLKTINLAYATLRGKLAVATGPAVHPGKE